MEMFVTCSKSLTSSRIIGILGRHDLDFPARRGKKAVLVAQNNLDFCGKGETRNSDGTSKQVAGNGTT